MVKIVHWNMLCGYTSICNNWTVGLEVCVASSQLMHGFASDKVLPHV